MGRAFGYKKRGIQRVFPFVNTGGRKTIWQRETKKSKQEKGKGKMRKNLKEARQRAGLTQQQMADKLGISTRYYRFIENGRRNGDFELWDKLEDFFGIHQRLLREISSD